MSPGEGLGAGGLCAAVPSRFSLSLSSGKAWAWAAQDPTPQSPWWMAVQRQALAGSCSGSAEGAL